MARFAFDVTGDFRDWESSNNCACRQTGSLSRTRQVARKTLNTTQRELQGTAGLRYAPFTDYFTTLVERCRQRRDGKQSWFIETTRRYVGPDVKL